MLEPFAALQYEAQGDELRGTALGLLLVRQIAKLHGATFRVERRVERTIAFMMDIPR